MPACRCLPSGHKPPQPLTRTCFSTGQASLAAIRYKMTRPNASVMGLFLSAAVIGLCAPTAFACTGSGFTVGDQLNPALATPTFNADETYGRYSVSGFEDLFKAFLRTSCLPACLHACGAKQLCVGRSCR